MALIRAAALLLALFALACDVEEPTFDVDGGSPDAAVVEDSGVGEDAGESEDCILNPAICADTEFCGADATCQARDRTCSNTTECGPLDVCARPLVVTSTLTPAGDCVPTPGGCTTDAECDGVCLAVGICGPRAARATLDGAALVPRAACAEASDCGLAGVCRGGICDTCDVNADCPGELRCVQGACLQPSSCTDDFQCFDGNICDGGGCLRVTEACTPDPENDSESDAQPIEDGMYTGLDICGDEEDWFALFVPESHGVEVVITSTASQATLTAALLDTAQAPVPGLGRLELPGIVVLRAPADAARELRLQVASADTSGGYDLSVRYRAGQCSDDPVELYGTGLEIPTNVVFEGRLCPGAEEHRTFAAQAGDELQARLELLGIESPAPTLALRDAQGTSLDASSATGTTVSATAAVAAAGDYGFVATARRLVSAGSPYRMRLVRKLAGREGACLAPAAIDPTGGAVTVRGDLSGAGDLGRPECTGIGGPAFAASARHDLLYGLVPPVQDSLLRVTVTPVSGTDPQLSVALLSECASDTSAVACETAAFLGTSASLEAALSPEGAAPTLIVSSDGHAEDVVFDLTVEYVSLASFADDRCVDATPLVTTGTQAVVLYGGRRDGVPWGARNDNTLWQNQVSAACSAYPDGAAGVDRFFSLSLAPDERAAVELSGPLGGMLWTGLDCADMAGTCQQAEVRDLDHPVLRATFTASVAGTEHLIVVDGNAAEDQGTFVLRTVRNAQCLEDSDCQGAGFNLCGAPSCRCDDYVCATPPSNDRCPGTSLTVQIGQTARVEGSTGAAEHDYALTCIDGDQPDVVYSVQIPPGATELVARITEATFDPALEVRQGVCVDTPNNEARCNDDVRADVVLPEVRVGEPSSQDLYYIVVDAYAGRGTFTLEVELR